MEELGEGIGRLFEPLVWIIAGEWESRLYDLTAGAKAVTMMGLTQQAHCFASVDQHDSSWKLEQRPWILALVSNDCQY